MLETNRYIVKRGISIYFFFSTVIFQQLKQLKQNMTVWPLNPLYYTIHRIQIQITPQHKLQFPSQSQSFFITITKVSIFTFKIQMGLSINNVPATVTPRHYNIHKLFLFCNYILLGAASSCIFLTLSLRLVPSLCGFFLILLHIFTIAGAVSGCAAVGANRWYSAHMVATVLTAIFQGSVSVLVFTRTGDFLGQLKSYVREEDGSVILKLSGGLAILIFFLEWIVLTLAFFLKYYACVEGGNNNRAIVLGSAKVHQQDEDLKDWPWPFQV